MRVSKNLKSKSKPTYAIVVDGECEYWYIQMLKRNERSINVNLEPKIPQKKKLSELYNKVIELSSDFDEVFWIIDFDVINFETRSAKKGAKTCLKEFMDYYFQIKKDCKNVQIIINNPCLEYWFLLHFEFSSKYFESCSKLLNQLKKHKSLSDYEKSQSYFTKQGNDIYLKLKPYINNAITNCDKLGEIDFCNPHNSLSKMNLLFESKGLKQIIKK